MDVRTGCRHGQRPHHQLFSLCRGFKFVETIKSGLPPKPGAKPNRPNAVGDEPQSQARSQERCHLLANLSIPLAGKDDAEEHHRPAKAAGGHHRGQTTGQTPRPPTEQRRADYPDTNERNDNLKQQRKGHTAQAKAPDFCHQPDEGGEEKGAYADAADNGRYQTRSRHHPGI